LFLVEVPLEVPEDPDVHPASARASFGSAGG
jgi:hypothetical protein